MRLDAVVSSDRGSGSDPVSYVEVPIFYVANLTQSERFDVFTAVTMKYTVFWDIKHQSVLHRRHITSPLQSSAT
jgi:hypothetical protein